MCIQGWWKHGSKGHGGKGRDTSPPPPLCVERGFTCAFSRNHDATVNLKSELISIKV